jgi:hypothetical protein
MFMMAMDTVFLDCVDGIHGRLCRLEGMHGGCRLEGICRLEESFLVGVDDAGGGVQAAYVQKVDSEKLSSLTKARALMVLRFTKDQDEGLAVLASLKQPRGFDDVMKLEVPQRSSIPKSDLLVFDEFTDIMTRLRRPNPILTPQQRTGMQYAAYLLLAASSRECVRFAIHWCQSLS